MTVSAKQLLHLYDNGKISRRDLIKKASALGLAGIAPAGLLSTTAQAATPKKGGHFSAATVQGSSSDSLNTISLTSGMTAFTFYTMHSQLTEILPNGEVAPLLAESYEAGSDPSQWIFKLRKGVEFHNGKTVDADDVIQSINRHKGENSTSSMKDFAEEVESITKDDDHTLIFKLKKASVDFPVVLSSFVFSIHPHKNGEIESFETGCGSYILESFEAGQRSTFKRNPNFYLDDRAFVDTAEILTIADTTARQNAIITNAVDLIGDVEAKFADRLANLPDIEILELTGSQHYVFPMLVDKPPFDNPDVRMALKLAIDRQEVLDKIVGGHGTLGNDHPISPINRYYAADLEQRSYDPDKAKWHLKQAGLDNLKVKLSVSDGLYGGATDTVVLYSEQAKKAGIDIEINRVPADGYWSDVWLKHPWCASYWSGRPTEDWMFTQGYAAESSWNESAWKNERFNQLLSEARAELDETKRRDMYYEMQSLVRDDGGSVVHLFANHIHAYKDGNVGVPETVAGNWEFDGYKMIERWWKT